MRKYICCLLSALLLCFPLMASSEADEADTMLKRAAALLELITDMNLSGADVSSPISRGEFMRLMGQAYRQNDISVYDGTFADVAADHPASAEIYSGLAQGYIARAEKFDPDGDMLGAAACKLAVCYGGFQPMAEAKGGYPAGYVLIAHQEKLLKNLQLSSDKAVTYRDAAVLVYNLLMAKAVVPTVIGKETVYSRTEESNLSMLHGIYTAEGVVNATPYSSITQGERSWGKTQIEVDGIPYDAEKVDEALLGCRCIVYYSESAYQTREMRLIVPNKNTIHEFSSKELISFQNGIAEFDKEEQNANVKLKLATNCAMVYNGRYVPFDETYLSQPEGHIRLIDRDDDDVIEVVLINRFRYLAVGQVSPNAGEIGDVNDSGNSIELHAQDVVYQLRDMEGEEITLHNIRLGDLLAVRESADRQLITIVRCGQKVTGAITAVNLEENELWVDDKPYQISSYLKEYYKSKLKPGLTGNFCVGMDGVLASCPEAEGGMQYAYLIACSKNGSSLTGGQLKVYTQGGEIKILDLADKLTVDGKSQKVTQQKLISDLTDGVYPCPSLMRIACSADNVVTKIDFPSVHADGTDADQLPEDNSLLEYQFPVSSFRYRSTPKSCMPYFNLKDTIVFRIPTDLSYEDGYSLAALSDDSTYSLSVYDLNKSGTAGAVVYRHNVRTASYGSGDTSYIVENITQGLDEEGNPAKQLHVWSKNGFTTLYLDDGVTVDKLSGKELCGGDIIRVKLGGKSKIMSLKVDIDASGETPVPNGTSTSLYEGGNEYITYQFGKVYEANDGYAYLSNSKNAFGEYNYDHSKLKNFYVQTQNIIKYNKKTHKLRPISLNELKSYTSFGEDNHYVVLRQRTFNIDSIYVYE